MLLKLAALKLKVKPDTYIDHSLRLAIPFSADYYHHIKRVRYMKKQIIILLISVMMMLGGCATSGQQFIDIKYSGSHEKSKIGKIGVAPFSDMRTGMGEGYLGYRILLDKSQETYMVKGMDLAGALKKAVMDYYNQNGFTAASIRPWNLSPEDIEVSSEDCKQIVAGTINQFECRAWKKGGWTEMMLDIDLTLYIGLADSNTLKTIPVSFTMEKTEFTFNREKLELFINQALEEVIQKALGSGQSYS